GPLASGSVGPTVRPLAARSASRQTLRLRSREAGRVDQELGGAELLVHVGVDTEERRIRRDSVRAGDVIDLSGSDPISLWPDLDGELWLHGRELEVLTADDPLPWGLLPLAREGGAFRVGEGRLRVADERSELILRYEVS
ncbi:MAG TPA: hypothetical protein VND93_19650, partial [Myxococcales bacterium]|nr:hypothetical protein [Myxococcales bacterium]